MYRRPVSIPCGLFVSAVSEELDMHYLGGLSGIGILICKGREIAPAAYDFDGFLRPTREVVSCGEIRLAASVLEDVFGHANVQIRTQDGRLLDLKFSEKTLDRTAEAAHVDVTGELPLGVPGVGGDHGRLDRAQQEVTEHDGHCLSFSGLGSPQAARVHSSTEKYRPTNKANRRRTHP
jgi:hypothetical protein